MFGEQRSTGSDVSSVQVGVDDDDVGFTCVKTRQLRKTRISRWTFARAGAFVGSHADSSPRCVTGRPREFGSIASCRLLPPLDEASNFAPIHVGHVVEFEQRLGDGTRLGVRLSSLDLGDTLAAQIIAAALEDCP